MAFAGSWSPTIQIGATRPRPRPSRSRSAAWRRTGSPVCSVARAAATRSGVLLGQLVPMMRPYRWRQVELIAYMAFGLTYALLLPLSTRYLVDDILPDGSGQRLLVFILGLFVIYVLNALVGMRRAYVTSWISQRLLVDLADRMFAHLQRLSHGFYVRAKVGDLMARLSGDLMVVQMAMAQLTGVGALPAPDRDRGGGDDRPAEPVARRPGPGHRSALRRLVPGAAGAAPGDQLRAAGVDRGDAGHRPGEPLRPRRHQGLRFGGAGCRPPTTAACRRCCAPRSA